MITAKLPFPLTQTFRTMLQRGVELNTLDVSYVSSLSWYFLTLFGLGGLNSIVLGEATSEYIYIHKIIIHMYIYTL